MMSNDWESFKKSVKPIKKPHNIKSVRKKNTKSFQGNTTTENPTNENDLQDIEIQVSKDWGFLEKNTLKKILRGNIKIMSRLDLHGQNVRDSKRLVLRFINSNFYKRQRLLLLITGKGQKLSVEDGWKSIGILKTIIPTWLRSKALHDKVLWFDYAPPNKGGDGAYLIYLRKSEDKPG